MAKPTLTGSRIRGYRLDRGLKQAELAENCGISPSYLNLIEHNRRRIGGALLNRIAAALGADPTILSDGAEAALTTALSAAATAHPEARPELDRAEEFAGRFPGWARLIGAQVREAQRLSEVVEALNDRLTHDPFLSASMHDVLSSVTAIRSASAILAGGEEIEPEWQARFHRNILEDSRRLAQSTESLVSYLDAGGDVDRAVSLPQDEVEAWLAERGWWVSELEEGSVDGDADTLAAEADGLSSAAARDILTRFLRRYAEDARAAPRSALYEAVARTDADPTVLAGRFGVSLPVIFRRLAALPPEAFPDAEPRGLVACDGSGTLTFRKSVPGFDLPRYGAACPLWPLFQSLQRPMVPLAQSLRMSGRDGRAFAAHAFAEISYPGGMDRPPAVSAWMLLAPTRSEAVGGAVGTSCRICAEPDCPARREPSLIAGPNPL